MDFQIDILVMGAALVALACVMIFLIARPGRKHRAEMLTLMGRHLNSDGSIDAHRHQPAPDHSVFISYRRIDSADIVGRLYDHLTSELGSKAVFKDVDSIDLGRDFRAQLEISLNACRILLCVIGDQWAGPAGSSSRLIDNPEDFVRIEIETALRRNIPVIPVLVRSVRMPSREFFPASLQDVAFRQGLPLRPDPDFRNDVSRLVASIRPTLQPRKETQ
jgi:hypothetical protein